MRRSLTLCAVFASILVLSACGTAPEDRAVSGAGIGAAGGAIIGAVTGLTVFQGAALGALGGALTGVLTDSDGLNLGEPFWRRSSARRGGSDDMAWQESGGSVGGSDLVAGIQAGLSDQGYDPGPVDGVMGPRTARAIRAYQSDRGLPSDGRASQDLARHIETASN